MYWMMLVAGIAGCGLDATTKIRCEGQTDCLDGYKCGADRICHATTKDGAANRLIFTTSAQYQGGNLGGLAGADTICRTHAAGTHFTGVFQAWLSDSTGSPSTRMMHGTGDYVLVDGTVVAHGWDDLVDGQLEHSVNLDETGAAPSAGESAHCMTGISAWTGTDFDGQFDPFENSCGHWDDSNSHGLIGDTNETSRLWTVACSMSCTELLSLYCVEQ